MRDSDVAIVGLACVFPGAVDLASYWRNIVNGVDAIRELPDDRWPGSRNCDLPRDHFAHIACRNGGFIPTPFHFDAIRFKVMPSVAAGGDADQFVLLHVLDDALRDAGIDANDPRRANTDVIVGRGGFTNKMVDLLLRADVIERIQRYMERRLPGTNPRELERMVEELNSGLPAAEPDSLATSIPNLVASRAANRLNLRGAAYNIDAACASSLIAVEQSMHRLRQGSCDVALACGISFTNIPTFWYLFTRILALSPTGAIRPFDRRADGLLIGEGAGAAVLKRLDDAVRDGDRIYAVIRGAGSASDGNDVGVLAPASSGQVRALERAYANAGVDPDTVGLLEAHGTGTTQGDAVEIESMKRFYGERKEPHGTRVMGSVKSMIGHTMAAAGMASLIKTTLALSNKLLPPSLHCEQPRPELEQTPFFVNGRVRPWVHGTARPPRRAGINAFGFGGINAHLVLEEVPTTTKRNLGRTASSPRVRPPLPGLRRVSELLTFTGATPAEVARRVRRAVHFIRRSDGGFELEDLAHTLAGETETSSPCKLAVVATDLANVTDALDSVGGALERGEPLTGHDEVFFGADASRSPGKIVGLFPGLAFPGLIGDYPDHLMTMCAHQPVMRAVFDLIEDRDELPEDPLPTSFLLRPPEHLPEDVRRRMRMRFAVWIGPGTENETGVPVAEDESSTPMDERLLSVIGMLASNEAGWGLLRPFGIPFDMLCGQSLGDLSALCAAGSVDFSEARERIWPYLKIDRRAADLGCLALVSASEAQLAPLLDRFSDVIIALHIAPEVQILGGAKDRVGKVVQLLRKEGIFCMILPIPPIHTPLMQTIQREIVETHGSPLPPFRQPSTTVYSSLTTEPMRGSPDELRELVMSNFSHPMRFWQTLRRIYDDGGRVFVQVGSGTLAGNVQTVLPEDDVLSVALDVDYRDPIRQLQHLCGKLFAAGVPLDLSGLYEARSPRKLELDTPATGTQPPRGAVPLQLYWPPLRVEREPAADDDVPTQKEPASGMPFIGPVIEFQERRKLVYSRRFSLDEDLYLADHTLVGRQHGKPVIDSFPVVPLTVTLEMIAEAAACLVPGCGVIGVEDIRAKRWIALDGVEWQDVTVEAIRDSNQDEPVTVSVDIRVDGDSVAGGRVLLASRYRETLDLQFSELSGSGPFPLPVKRLYTDHHFFHGPRFHCLETIHARGEQGIVGELVVPDYDGFLRSRDRPALLLDPVVLDGTAQLLGAILFDRGVHILPVAVERIELYRPAPPPGTRVPVRLEITECNHEERRVRAIVEVQDGSGKVWFRIEGLQELIFRYSKRLRDTQREPARHTLSEESPLPGLPAGAVATMLPRPLLRDTRSDDLARIFLHHDERSAFEAAGRNTSHQREWLMGRIAAKDAVRLWLGRRDDGPMPHAHQLVIENDPDGRPIMRSREGRRDLPAVSIAHKADVAVAIATDGPIGIDVEPTDAGQRLRLEDVATDREIARLQQTVGHENPAWLTRLWCGKEAAAKALGTGLQGRPRAFEAVELAADGRLVIENGEPRRRVQVLTSQENGWTFAVASIPPTS